MRVRHFIIIFLIFLVGSLSAFDQKANLSRTHLNLLSVRQDLPANPLLSDNIDFFGKHNATRKAAKPLSLSKDRDEIEVLINGEEATEIEQGEDFIVTVFFSDDCFEAEAQTWIDMDGNGIFDETIDFNIDEGETIMDNDIDDENPAEGVYQVTIYAEEDGPNNVGDLGIFYVVSDAGGTDHAYLYIDELDSDYSVSGDITPALANLVVGVIPIDEDIQYMTVTDETGHYQGFVPDTGFYHIMTFDPLGITGGLFPDTTYFNVEVNGHLTGYDFNYIAPSATVQGYVTDESGSPMIEYEVAGSMEEGGNIWTETDENGFYQLGVTVGDWRIGMRDEDLIPDYLVPNGFEIEIEEEETVDLDIEVFTTNSSISGQIFLDGVPVSGILLGAWCELGWTEETNGLDGYYELNVSDLADEFGGYEVSIHDFPPGVYVDEFYNNIPSGSSGIDFHLHSASGGIQGTFFDAETDEPLSGGWLSATQDYVHWFNAGVYNNGNYSLTLPNGIYTVYANSENYFPEQADQVIIQDEMLNFDFYLTPITFGGAVFGNVFDNDSGTPLENAQVTVSNDLYWAEAYTDETGYYYLDLPNGNYWLDANLYGYWGEHIDDLIINNDQVQADFHLTPIDFNGSLSGFVFDSVSEEALANVSIWINSANYWINVFTTFDGSYFAELPNGEYWLDIQADGYVDHIEQDIVIADNDITLDIYLDPETEVEEDQISNNKELKLQSFPNPFSHFTTISFESAQSHKNSQIEIYNHKGQKVKTFFNQQIDKSSNQQIIWKGVDEEGKPVASGIYFLKFSEANSVLTKKIIKLK